LCSDTAPCDLTKFLFCNPVTDVCQAATIVAAGQPCGLVNGGYAACQAGGTCNGTLPPLINSGTCAAPAADGKACGTGPNEQDCLSPAVCRSGLCALPNGVARGPRPFKAGSNLPICRFDHSQTQIQRRPPSCRLEAHPKFVQPVNSHS
jgi:hypothetical protein